MKLKNKWIYYGSTAGQTLSSNGKWSISMVLWTTPTDIPAAEAAALKAFYDATGGADWTNKTGWGTSATADDWYGVTVTEGHVTGVALANNNLIGDAGATLPTTLTSLDLGQNTGLDDIDLSGNAALKAIDLAGCEFGQAVVSGTLADLVTAGVTSATVDIGGSNSSPKPTGVAALMTLEDAGCTLTYSTIIMANTGTFYGIFANGDATVRSSALDLSGQSGKYIRVRDTAGKYAMAYGHAADDAEALGAEKITLWTNHPTTPFDTLTQSGGAISQAVNLSAKSASCDARMGTAAIPLGTRIRFVYDYVVSSGSLNSQIGLWASYGSGAGGQYISPVLSTYSAGTVNLVATQNQGAVHVGSSFACDFALTTSLKIYTALGTDALQLRSAATGTTRNWTTIEAGFNYETIAKVEVFNG